ncbi:MAG: SMP-30/gluconolactonase/LRE family protein, partial [Planctomycetota bacterium]
MKKKVFTITVIFIVFFTSEIYGQGQSDNKTITFRGAPKKLTGGFLFTEGPAADQEGNVYFTDIPNNRIHKWSADGKLSTFLENSDGANGLSFDENGNLLACLGGTGKLVSIDAQGKSTILADQYEDKPFNSLND